MNKNEKNPHNVDSSGMLKNPALPHLCKGDDTRKNHLNRDVRATEGHVSILHPMNRPTENHHLRDQGTQFIPDTSF